MCSPKALAFDFTYSRDQYFATVEFKGSSGAFVSRWVISGLSKDGLPMILMAVDLAMANVEESKLIEEARVLAESHLFPLAENMAPTRGMQVKFEQTSLNHRSAVFREHMFYQFEQTRSGSLTRQLQTECLYMMANFLGVSAPQKLIAEFQGVKVSTVNERLKYAKERGRIPKMSDLGARKALPGKDQIAKES
jgi:hypothetical protein